MSIIQNAIAENFGVNLESTDKSNILDLNKDRVIKLFQEFGVIWFRGFEVDTVSFKVFTEYLGTNFVSYVGGANKREPIGGDKTIVAVVPQNYGVPLHGEMYYKKLKPGVVWFYCETPALSGGQTTLCDGAEFYNQLRPSTQEMFSRKKIKYIRHYLGDSWQEIYQTNDLDTVAKICAENDISFSFNEKNKSVETEYVTPAVIPSSSGNHQIFINNILPVVTQELDGKTGSLVRFEDDTKIPFDILLEFKEISNKLTISVDWKHGEILMIDNTRILHGRRAFSDTLRQVYSRLCDPAF